MLGGIAGRLNAARHVNSSNSQSTDAGSIAIMERMVASGSEPIYQPRVS
jgi:hypothetical protein